MDNDTLLIVCSGNGMTELGDHGGGSLSEIDSMIFFYGKKPFAAADYVNIKNLKFILCFISNFKNPS